jgi:hypothetical protein
MRRRALNRRSEKLKLLRGQAGNAVASTSAVMAGWRQNRQQERYHRAMFRGEKQRETSCVTYDGGRSGGAWHLFAARGHQRYRSDSGIGARMLRHHQPLPAHLSPRRRACRASILRTHNSDSCVFWCAAASRLLESFAHAVEQQNRQASPLLRRHHHRQHNGDMRNIKACLEWRAI